ncbi:lytic transglycosylase domain-containing protein [Vannielia litorea]|uniref:Transglycosylase SLT domain-containing protein n=1 Tax=Vannielia litorea TaxID=1217970 RepID=A0A1N6IJ90_9RHOB|nr:lytic transglycosylase domain-containing protein [Vannielia litorea]SIO32082.1 hypothetical protein SAMN05444002_3963 [Vannielia litorea]
MTLLTPPEGGPSVAPRGLSTPPHVRPFASRSMRRLFVLLAALALALLSLPALAQPSRPELCEAAAREASASTGVPLSVLRAIMLTVSGRKSEEGLVPWPWTIGAGGERVWFETADDARAYAYQQIKRGEPALGLGCFQVDYARYGTRFASLEDMLTPRINAEFAAALLLGLHAETGGWGYAAAALQGLGEAESEPWLATFYRHRDAARQGDFEVAGHAAATGPEDDRPRLNTYPLLQDSGETRVLGSLVPTGSGSPGASLFTPADGL